MPPVPPRPHPSPFGWGAIPQTSTPEPCAGAVLVSRDAPRQAQPVSPLAGMTIGEGEAFRAGMRFAAGICESRVEDHDVAGRGRQGDEAELCADAIRARVDAL